MAGEARSPAVPRRSSPRDRSLRIELALAVGHRSVQGIAFSPGGKAYSIEHGTGRDDGVDRLFAGANGRRNPGEDVES